METARALIADYSSHVANFDAIAKYLSAWQPPALSWMQVLPRMEAHIFDAGHMLLETHSEPALALMAEFVRESRKQPAA
jgi:surfactin synthase thioesterase subunit